MRRAVLVSAGTVAGLAWVLSYSDGRAPTTDVLASGPDGLGAPASEPAAPVESPSARPTTPKPQPKPTRTATRKPSAKPTAEATSKAPSPARTTSAPAPRTSSAKPAPSPTPKPTATRTAKPTPTPTPTPTPSVRDGDFLGTAVTHRHGTVQVGIRVVDGVIIEAWAERYPTGDAMQYSQYSIPRLTDETIGATSANVAAVSGATLTSKAWVTSLAAAMSKAGL